MMPLSSGHGRLLVAEVAFPVAVALTVVVTDDDGGVEDGVSIFLLFLGVVVMAGCIKIQSNADLCTTT